MAGVDEYGIVDKHEHIFDIFTKLYDFLGSNVQVMSAQDLWKFYESKNKGADKKKVNIYQLVEFFVRHHPFAHYILDECPFLKKRTKDEEGDSYQISIMQTNIFISNIKLILFLRHI